MHELSRHEELHDPALSRQLIAGIERLGTALRAQAWSEGFTRGLTPTQGRVLTVLRTHAGQGLRLSQVAESLSVTPATASDAVSSLVSKGLVKKTQAASDARAVELSLTREGSNEAQAVAEWPSFLLDAVNVLSEDAQAGMLRGVLTIISELQQRGHISVARTCVSCTHFRANAHPGKARPHHCELLDAALADAELKAECGEHDPAPATLVAENARKFRSGAGKRRLPLRA
jgi:DNA-binding MarR family transcriptional regulator